MVFKRIKDWLTTITSFRSGDVIPVDGPSGTAKMEKDVLLQLTAQNALADNVAQAFDESGNTDYIAGESVVRGGKTYVFNVDHTGVWNAEHMARVNEQELNRKIGVGCCKIIGNGDTSVIYKIFAREGSSVRIVPRQTTWDLTGVASNHTKLAVRRRTRSGSNVDFMFIAYSGVVPDVIDVNVPIDTAWIEIFIRAAVGASLFFDVFDNTSIQPDGVPYLDLFEMGNITMSANSLSYSYGSETRMRTKRGSVVKVNKGDVIGVKSGFQMYVAFTEDGASPYSVVGWVGSFTCQKDGYVAVLVRKGIGSDVATTFEELFGAIFVKSFSCGFSSIPNIFSKLDYCWNVLNERFYGYNATAKIWRFIIPNDMICRIIPSKTEWSTANIGGDDKNKLIVRKVKSDGSIQSFIEFSRLNIIPPFFDFVVPDDAVALEIFFRADSGEVVDFAVQCLEQRGLVVPSRSALLKSINHRGYNSIAPENTLPAFRLSAKRGFGIVETDVRLTSDGKLVCIHDATVDRTSNGIGNVADMTLEELKALDFGSWKSAAYAGTTIPTYEEFLVCCRNLGLDVYVELKDVTGHYDDLLEITRKIGMKEHTTFIADSVSKLVEINNRDASYRVGYVVSSITEERISDAMAMFNANKNLFIDVNFSGLTDGGVNLAKGAGIPIEVWTVDSITSLLSLNAYISGVTSNYYVASNYVYASELAKLA